MGCLWVTNTLLRFIFNKDLEFVVANKVTRIINCAALTIANQWEPIGILYLSFRWNDDDTQVILDAQNQNIAQIFQFIEEAVEKIESVLVVSTKGQSRSSTVIVAYLMKKYKWTLLKTLEYLNSRRPDLEIRTAFIQQLSEYESYLSSNGEGCKTTKWSEVFENNDSFDNEELLLRNTFINSQMGPLAVLDYNIPKSKPVIGFIEDTKLATEINYNILHEQSSVIVLAHRKKDKSMLLPIIKTPGSRSSRNAKIESERSFGKKSDHTKYVITKGPIKKVKMISPQDNIQNSDRSELNVKAFSSPIMSTDDNEPKAKFPYKKVINLNSHKEKPQTQSQSPIKVNNYITPETKPLQTGSQFMNMLKNGIQPKQDEKAVTNIIQNPNINNIIILNQPNIHVISQQSNNDKSKDTAQKKADEQRRQNSYNQKEENKEKDSVPFPKNPLSVIFKSSTLLKDISRCPPSSKIRASMERNQSEKNILSNYKNGPIKLQNSARQNKAMSRPTSVPGKNYIDVSRKPDTLKVTPSAHFRPSSPGLYGKTISPTLNYNLSSMSGKVYDQMPSSKSLSNIKRIENVKSVKSGALIGVYRTNSAPKPKWR